MRNLIINLVVVASVTLVLAQCQSTTEAAPAQLEAPASPTPAASTKSPAGAVACADQPVVYDACTRAGETCATPAGCCVCEPGPACEPGLAWSCLAPPQSQDPTCPPAPPQPQSSCPKVDVSCSYCTCSQPSLWRCVAGPAKPPFWAKDELRVCR